MQLPVHLVAPDRSQHNVQLVEALCYMPQSRGFDSR
jgi:hypothetical protein